jgi:A/G-specific adenine glycosylase
MWDEKKIRRFRKNLLRWYREHRRALPWRNKPTPYKVWISEIMLQQTQTRSVLRYYDRFLKRFPNLESLAQASQQQVLEFWSGLGYYTRALNLQKAARRILEVHKTFPEEFSTVLSLPGIGRYTAGAICSIAFNKAYPIVDGNIRRVLTRLNGKKGCIPESFFWKIMSALVPIRTPSDFNQGMMELGALVCLPFKPQCLQCPVEVFCEAKRLGIEQSIPSVRRKQVCTRIRIAILVLEQNGSILLSASGKHSFIPGNWELPCQIVPDRELPEVIASSLCRRVLGNKIRLMRSAPVRHTISNRQITGFVFYGKAESPRSRARTDGFRWEHRSSLKTLLTSSLFFKAIAGTAAPFREQAKWT